MEFLITNMFIEHGSLVTEHDLGKRWIDLNEKFDFYHEQNFELATLISESEEKLMKKLN